MSAPQTEKVKKLAWQCRRGMLELDVILIPFLEKHFADLSSVQQDRFEQLLNEADPDLYTWIMGYGHPEKASQLEIVNIIRAKMAIA